MLGNTTQTADLCDFCVSEGRSIALQSVFVGEIPPIVQNVLMSTFLMFDHRLHESEEDQTANGPLGFLNMEDIFWKEQPEA